MSPAIQEQIRAFAEAHRYMESIDEWGNVAIRVVPGFSGASSYFELRHQPPTFFSQRLEVGHVRGIQIKMKDTSAQIRVGNRTVAEIQPEIFYEILLRDPDFMTVDPDYSGSSIARVRMCPLALRMERCQVEVFRRRNEGAIISRPGERGGTAERAQLHGSGSPIRSDDPIAKRLMPGEQWSGHHQGRPALPDPTTPGPGRTDTAAVEHESSDVMHIAVLVGVAAMASTATIVPFLPGEDDAIQGVPVFPT